MRRVDGKHGVSGSRSTPSLTGDVELGPVCPISLSLQLLDSEVDLACEVDEMVHHLDSAAIILHLSFLSSLYFSLYFQSIFYLAVFYTLVTSSSWLTRQKRGKQDPVSGFDQDQGVVVLSSQVLSSMSTPECSVEAAIRQRR